MKNSPIPSISQNGEGLVASARQRLMLFGVKEHQIAELEKAGQAQYPPAHLHAALRHRHRKDGPAGAVREHGRSLFNIADLSTVWVEIEVYENEFPYVQVGQQVEIVSQSYPGKTFTGRVGFIYPFLDPKTRTVKARVEMPNPGHEAETGHVRQCHHQGPAGQGIVVPVTAVMDTGKRQVVWVEMTAGHVRAA